MIIKTNALKNKKAYEAVRREMASFRLALFISYVSSQ